MENLRQIIEDSLNPILDKLKAAIQPLIEQLLDQILPVIEESGLFEALEGIMQEIADTILTLFQIMEPLLNQGLLILEPILRVLGDSFSNLDNIFATHTFEDVIDGVIEEIDEIMETLEEDLAVLNDYGEEYQETVEAYIEAIPTFTPTTGPEDEYAEDMEDANETIALGGQLWLWLQNLIENQGDE